MLTAFGSPRRETAIVTRLSLIRTRTARVGCGQEAPPSKLETADTTNGRAAVQPRKPRPTNRRRAGPQPQGIPAEANRGNSPRYKGGLPLTAKKSPRLQLSTTSGSEETRLIVTTFFNQLEKRTQFFTNDAPNFHQCSRELIKKRC
ncbi:Hypothetical protein NTJ_01219 [Nesidiocoris tenuis]|uniref:Uncharacterized protein n=1 Tax=Nesidiocoris tenuis TaxID=355587 RepID=A0ABN7A8V7_9HEMI|nr:Hypothetical protein NTJ_01219 [Nesidiocoris tenuis]